MSKDDDGTPEGVKIGCGLILYLFLGACVLALLIGIKSLWQILWF
jgi:hypothetical protein